MNNAKAEFIIANELTLTGRRLLQLSRAPKSKRSYNLSCKLFALTGLARSVVDGELLRRGLVREKRHQDHTRSYVLTDKGKQAAKHIETKLAS